MNIHLKIDRQITKLATSLGLPNQTPMGILLWSTDYMQNLTKQMYFLQRSLHRSIEKREIVFEPNPIPREFTEKMHIYISSGRGKGLQESFND